MYRAPKIIVVGGNAAGPSAAAKAKRINPDAEVILFEAGNFISTGTCELPYLFSGEISDYNKLIYFTHETFFKEKGVKVYINHAVKAIETKYKVIDVVNRETNNTIEFEYDKLILTTGSVANKIPKLPFSLENVFSLKSVSDYIKINSFINNHTVKNILVVGSGYIGLEISDALKNAGYNVFLIDQEEKPLPSADDEIQFIIQDILTKNQISFLSIDEKTKYIIKDNLFKNLKYKGRFIEFDLAIVTAGVKPNTVLANDVGLKLGHFGGLKVDSRLKTSNPDIFAAGDNIEIKNFITRKNDYIPLATMAHSYGHIAGENAAGGNRIAEPIILNAAFKLFDKFVAQVGLNYKQAEATFGNVKTISAVVPNKVKIMPNSTNVFGKVIYDGYSGNILGASFIGSNEISGYADIIATMIYNKINVKNLAKVNYNYTPPLSPFINLLSVLGRKI